MIVETRRPTKKLKTDNLKEIRVCAYCRVSTDKEDQKNSFETQKRYFEREFLRNDNWIDCGIYADEGLSGTSVEKREEFLKMLDKAKRGEVDLIITKEVSRFSRNILDTLSIVNELASKEVYIYFIADRINTEVPKDIERLNQLALYAEQESRRTSERVKWGQLQQMEHGVVFGRKRMYAYNIKRNEYGEQYFEIIENEAETVRNIFKWYADGDGTHIIARRLEKMGIPATYKKGWSNTVILRILRQEKYVGDIFQGKTFTPNPLTHKKKYNRGDSESVYITDHHPESAIIDRELWNKVQKRLEENTTSDEIKAKHNNRYWLSGKVFCGVCGSRYVSFQKKQQFTPYKAWVCFENHQRGIKKTITNDLGEVVEIGCNGKRVNERILTTALYDIMSELLRNSKKQMCKSIEEDIKKLNNNGNNIKAIHKAEQEIQKLENRISVLTDNLADETISKIEYKKKVAEYQTEIQRHKETIKKLKLADDQKEQIRLLQEMKQQIEFYATLKDDELNEELFARVTKKIIVHPEQVLEFHLSFLSRPMFMQYETTGKGKYYKTTFTILNTEKGDT